MTWLFGTASCSEDQVGDKAAVNTALGRLLRAGLIALIERAPFAPLKYL